MECYIVSVVSCVKEQGRESKMKLKAKLARLAGRIADYEKVLLPKAKSQGQYHKPGSMKK